MKTIEMSAIQGYYGQSDNGLNWFIWNQITIPEEKESFIYRINNTIPDFFGLKEEERAKAIDFLLLVEHNNGINQYFPFLKDYASEEVRNFVHMASDSDTLNLEQKQIVK